MDDTKNINVAIFLTGLKADVDTSGPSPSTNIGF
jgi:hypothetical protein